MIYDLDGPYLLVSYTYLCMNPTCGRKNMCSDPRSLAFLGYDRASQYDFFLTSKSGVSRRLLTSLKCAITGGMSFTGQSDSYLCLRTLSTSASVTFVCFLVVVVSGLILTCPALPGYASMLTSMYRETYDLQRCAHVGHLARRVALADDNEYGFANLFGVPQSANGSNTAKNFPVFESRGINGYYGSIPSRRSIPNTYSQTLTLPYLCPLH